MLSSSEDEGGQFVNPLLMKGDGKKKGKKDEDFSSADEDDEKLLKKEKGIKEKKENKLLGKRKKPEEEDDVGDFFANTEIEIVPQTKIKSKEDQTDSEPEDGYASMDSEDLAETRALAKVMLRKKNREEILESTYNRFSTFEDKSNLPDWFVEDEAKHYKACN